MVEQSAVNRSVVGSNRTRGANIHNPFGPFAVCFDIDIFPDLGRTIRASHIHSFKPTTTSRPKRLLLIKLRSSIKETGFGVCRIRVICGDC